MSLTISRAEGVTVYTVHSNHNSKCPLFCQILGTLCYSPVCSVSLSLKQQLGCALTALATTQIMVGIMNLGFGILSTVYGINLGELGPLPLYLGGVILALGIISILAEKFPSPCLVALTAVMNIVSAGLAIATIVLYSVDLAGRRYWYTCDRPERRQDFGSWTTPSPAKQAEWDRIFERKLESYRICQQNMSIMKAINSGLDIMMLVFAVLHLCVAISWCVLSIKALRKKKADGPDMEDPEICKPLMEEETPNPVC